MLNSPVDIAIVAGMILLVFGPKKVPEFGKALGQGIGNFKKALSDASEEVKSGMEEVEKKNAKPVSSDSEVKTNGASPAAEPETTAKT